MQTSAAAVRIAAEAQSGNVLLNKAAGQLVIDDWRLRGWALTASGGAWAAPTSPFRILSGAQGDFITKSSSSTGYRAHVGYRAHIGYIGVPASSIWDLAYQDLGHNTPVSFPDGGTGTPYLTSVAIDATTDLLCWYANKPRNGFDAGIYVQRVVDDGSSHLYWSEPIQVFGSTSPDDTNESSIFFISFPRLQVINGEYWIVALECSLQNVVVTYHLCYFRSIDGIHWSDREYLAGVSNDTAEANAGINSYLNSSTPTPFTRADLVSAYLAVSGTSTYLISNGGSGNFVCGSTSLVGITNPARQVDITANVKAWSLSLPTAPTSAQGRYTIQNPGGLYNDSAIIVPGSRLVHQAGYVTSAGNDLLTLAHELVDEIRQTTALDDGGSMQNMLEITTEDYAAWLRDWQPDVYWEWNSPRMAVFDEFCDLSAFTIMNGKFLIQANAVLQAGVIDSGMPYPDDVAYIHEQRTWDGSLDVQFRLRVAQSGIWAGVALQGVDERNFWVVRYNGDSSKYELVQAYPTTSGHKNYQYQPAVQQSSVVSLTTGTFYWLKVEQWHNRVLAFHSTDRITWTKVIDYTGGLATIASNLPANAAYWGLVGKSRAIPSGAIGQTNYLGGKQDMSDGAGNPKMFALRVQTGAVASTLRALAVLAGSDAAPPNLRLGLVRDVGSGLGPADVTNANNVLFEAVIPSLAFSSSDSPSWVGASPGVDVTLAASTYYWIYVTFDGTLSGTQAWYWFSLDPAHNSYGTNLTRQSSNGGLSWSSLSDVNLDLAAALFSDIDGAFAEFGAMYWTSAESAKTIERIAWDIGAKAWVLNDTVDSFVQTSDLVLATGVLWQPSSFGVIGDLVLDCDVNISGTGIIVLRASGTGGAASTGYQVKVDPGNQRFQFYQPSAVLSEQIDSCQYLPSGSVFHLTVVNWLNFILVYVNNSLAATYYDPTLTTPGYIGLVNSGATWTNVRVPDMTQIKAYHVVEAGKNAQTALEELTAKSRFKWFLRFDGSLRIGSFAHLTPSDSYQATIEQAQKVGTGRHAVNQLTPSGNYYATRFSALLLDTVGKRRFQMQDYTDASSNQQAYLDADLVLQRAQELQVEGTLESTAVLANEREDVVAVTNAQDGTSAVDYIINDITIDYALAPTAKSTQKIGLRLAVS